MKIRKIAIAMFLVIALALCLAACSSAESIKVKTRPSKLVYSIGEELDITGGVIEVTYSNGSVREIQMTDKRVDVSKLDSAAAGEKTITVTYLKYSDTFTVTVSPHKATAISVDQDPALLTYFIGQAFNPDGGMLKVSYDDNTSALVAMNAVGVTFSYDFSTVGTKQVSIGYLGCTATLNVSVIEAEALDIIESPALLTYYCGDEFVPAGGIVKLTYVGGITEEISMDDDRFEFDYDFSEAGDAIVTISFREVSAQIEVEVLSFESFDWTGIETALDNIFVAYDENNDVAFYWAYTVFNEQFSLITANTALLAYFLENHGEEFELYAERFEDIYLPAFDTSEEFMYQFGYIAYREMTFQGYFYYNEFIEDAGILMNLYYNNLGLTELAEIVMYMRGAYSNLARFAVWFYQRSLLLEPNENACYFQLIQAELHYVMYLVYDRDVDLDLFRLCMFDTMNLFETFTDGYFEDFFGAVYFTYLSIFNEYYPEPVDIQWVKLRYAIRELYKISYISPLFYHFYNEYSALVEAIYASEDEDIINYFELFYGEVDDYVNSVMSPIIEENDLFRNENAVEFLYLVGDNAYIREYVLNYAFASWFAEDLKRMIDMYEALDDIELALVMSFCQPDQYTYFEYYYSELSLMYYRQVLDMYEGSAYFTLVKADMYYRYYEATNDVQNGLDRFIQAMRVTIDRYIALPESGRINFNLLFEEIYLGYREIYYTYIPLGMSDFQTFINNCNTQWSSTYQNSVFLYYYIRLMDKVEEVLDSGDAELIAAYNDQFASKIAPLTANYDSLFAVADHALLKGIEYKEFMLVFSDIGRLHWSKWWQIPAEYLDYENEVNPLVEKLLPLYNALTVKDLAMLNRSLNDFAGTLIGSGTNAGALRYYYGQFFTSAEVQIVMELHRAQYLYGAYIYYGVTSSLGSAGVKTYVESAMSRYNALPNKTNFDEAFGDFYLLVLSYYDELFPA